MMLNWPLLVTQQRNKRCHFGRPNKVFLPWAHESDRYRRREEVRVDTRKSRPTCTSEFPSTVSFLREEDCVQDDLRVRRTTDGHSFHTEARNSSKCICFC